jgi:hypothetical protein
MSYANKAGTCLARALVAAQQVVVGVVSGTQSGVQEFTQAFRAEYSARNAKPEPMLVKEVDIDPSAC